MSKILALASFLVLLAPAARAEELSADLLKRLAAADDAASKAQDTGSYLLTVHGEELDKAGKATKVDDVVMRVSHVDGVEKDELVKEVKDGKDVTEDEKKKQADAEKKKDDGKAGAKKKDDDDDGDFDASPFASRTQSQYVYTAKGHDADRPDLLHVHFEPKKASTKLMAGEAWVDEASASVRHLEVHPSINPTFVQKLEIRMDMTFDPEHGNLPSKMELEGEGGMLFIKKRFKATTLFSEWSFPK